MKSPFCIITLFFSSFISLFAEIEPNDNCQTANAINLGGSITGNFEHQNDRDFFVFYVTKPGLVDIEVINSDASFQISGAIYSINCNNGFGFRAKNFGQIYGKSSFNLCDTGFYLISLNESNYLINLNQYTLTVHLNNDDQYECNNTLEKAKYIPLDTLITAYLIGYDILSIKNHFDLDYYKVFVPSKGKLDIDLPLVPHDSDFVLQVTLYDTLGNLLAQDCICGNTWLTEYIQTIICDPGIYIIRVFEWNGMSSLDPYKMVVRFTHDPSECNDNLEDAYPIENGQILTGYLGGPNVSTGVKDVDYYSFYVPRPGVFDLNIFRKDTFQYQITVFNPDKKQVILTNYYTNGIDTWNDHSLCDVGIHTIELIDRTSEECGKRKNKFTQYQLQLQNKYPDGQECNNTYASATSVFGNETIYAALASLMDTDMYKIHLEKSDTLYIRIDSMSIDVHCEQAIIKSPNIKLQSTSIRDSARISFVNNSTSGDFFIRLYAGGFEYSYQ